MPASELTFPLVSHRRLIGLSFGAMRSARRGIGSDIAGSRPYRPGDDMDMIDWNASAKLSAARGHDEFIVREHYAEEAPRVVALCDRGPSMSYYSAESGWLSKPLAVHTAVQLIADSAVAARGFMGYLDFAQGDPRWHPPRSQHERWQPEESSAFQAPGDNVVQGLGYLAQHRRAFPSGSFLFVLSDFLVAPTREVWLTALGQRWDIVPVVVQDPRWEQSFPDVAGLSIGLTDPETGRTRYVRLSRREASARREANERRLAELVVELRRIALEPVIVSSSQRSAVLAAFLAWADRRRTARPWGH